MKAEVDTKLILDLTFLEEFNKDLSLMEEEEKGKGREGKARQGKARQGKAKQGKARQGKARQGKGK